MYCRVLFETVLLQVSCFAVFYELKYFVDLLVCFLEIQRSWNVNKFIECLKKTIYFSTFKIICNCLRNSLQNPQEDPKKLFSRYKTLYNLEIVLFTEFHVVFTSEKWNNYTQRHKFQIQGKWNFLTLVDMLFKMK